MIPVTRLNHAVLYVRNLERSRQFYQEVFGFEEVSRMGDRAAFFRAKGSENHHDLGLISVGENAPLPPLGATGLYHLAWEVGSIEDLAAAAEVLRERGCLYGASDHGTSKSLYAKDPDSNEFEIVWQVPRQDWGKFANQAAVMPLNLQRELELYGKARC